MMENAGIFFVTVLGMILIPGPDLLFVTSRVLSFGKRAAFASSLGIACGYLIHTALVAAGVQVIFQNWPIFFDIIKFMGLGYLIYLAIMLLRARDFSMGENNSNTRGGYVTFKQGMVTSLLNPKGLMLFFSLIPQFYVEGSGAFWQFSLIMGAIASLTCFCVYATIGYTIGTTSERWVGSANQGPLIAKATSVILIAVVIFMFLNT